MAQVLTSLSATRTRQVFAKPPDLQREFTPFPRAIVQYGILNGVIDAKPINDTAELVVGMTFGTSFAYRMVDFSVSLTQDTANDWRAVAYVEFLNAIRGTEPGLRTRHAVALQDTTIRDNSLDELWIAVLTDRMPRYVIQATRQGIAPTVSFLAMNLTAAAAAAGTIDFYAAFLEYDIEQVENFPIHYPVTTYAR